MTHMKRIPFREDHEQFREQVRRFVEREIVPFHPQWEKDGIVPREAWAKAGSTPASSKIKYRNE